MANHADDKRSLVTSHIMTPEYVNFGGNVHGGYILLLVDRVAYACGSRYAGKYVVTRSVDQVFFKEPIHVGELVSCHANVNYVGTTSMEIGVRVVAEDLMTSKVRHTNSCYFTMVAVDSNGKPTQIPPLTIHNELQQRRFDEAVIRRQARLQMEKMHVTKKD